MLVCQLGSPLRCAPNSQATAIAAIFVWRLVPETKGKTLEDMTRLWRKELPPEQQGNI